jgi:hypothetical protein
VYVALCGYLYATQRAQSYFPTPETFADRARDLRIETDGVTLQVWHVPRDGAHALIYFGGNAEDVAANVEDFQADFPDHALYLVNYRGYGASTGSPSESALFADAVAVYEHVRTRHASISVAGRSLGSGVAAHLASVRPVHRVALVTPYDSLANVAQAHFPLFPVRFLLRDRFDAASKATRIAAPTLIVIAGRDEIIPVARSKALAAAFTPGQARVEVIAQADHNSLDLFPEYRQALREFLRIDPRG